LVEGSEAGREAQGKGWRVGVWSRAGRLASVEIGRGSGRDRGAGKISSSGLGYPDIRYESKRKGSLVIPVAGLGGYCLGIRDRGSKLYQCQTAREYRA
jgi:hypothetical protein